MPKCSAVTTVLYQYIEKLSSSTVIEKLKRQYWKTLHADFEKVNVQVLDLVERTFLRERQGMKQILLGIS